jgi:NAD+ synthase
MSDRLNIALAQINPTVGDLKGNAELIRKARAEAANEGADLVVATELSISGYPPEDLVLKPAFVAACREAVEALAKVTADGGPGLIVGSPWHEETVSEAAGNGGNGRPFNAALLLDGGQVQTWRAKVDLPNYSVFDEKRVFQAGPLPGPVNVRGVRLGLMVCEDMWTPDVAECLEESGAEILVVPNGSPYERDKVDLRMQLGVARVTETGLPLVYVNQVGGQDELVFDGASFVLDADHSLRVQLPSFEESLVVTRWRRGPEGAWACDDGEKTPPEDGMEPIYRTLVPQLQRAARSA